MRLRKLPFLRSSKIRVAVQLLAATLVLIGFNGCGKTGVVPEIVVHEPPTEFSEAGQKWTRSTSSVSKSDNTQIGKFFERNPSLLDSPEWTGEPAKYVNSQSKSKIRFYWFGGSSERPTWSALEIDGGSLRELSGEGYPGS